MFPYNSIVIYIKMSSIRKKISNTTRDLLMHSICINNIQISNFLSRSFLLYPFWAVFLFYTFPVYRRFSFENKNVSFELDFSCAALSTPDKGDSFKRFGTRLEIIIFQTFDYDLMDKNLNFRAFLKPSSVPNGIYFKTSSAVAHAKL